MVCLQRKEWDFQLGHDQLNQHQPKHQLPCLSCMSLCPRGTFNLSDLTPGSLSMDNTYQNGTFLILQPNQRHILINMIISSSQDVNFECWHKLNYKADSKGATRERTPRNVEKTHADRGVSGSIEILLLGCGRKLQLAFIGKKENLGILRREYIRIWNPSSWIAMFWRVQKMVSFYGKTDQRICCTKQERGIRKRSRRYIEPQVLRLTSIITMCWGIRNFIWYREAFYTPQSQPKIQSSSSAVIIL